MQEGRDAEYTAPGTMTNWLTESFGGHWKLEEFVDGEDEQKT